MEKTRCEAGLFFVMPSITIVFLISFGLLDRCSFRTLFELEGTSKPQLSFSKRTKRFFHNSPTPLRQEGLGSCVNLFIQKEAFGFDGGLTAGACGSDGLTIGGVGTVACDEDAGELRTGCSVYLLQVTDFIGV